MWRIRYTRTFTRPLPLGGFANSLQVLYSTILYSKQQEAPVSVLLYERTVVCRQLPSALASDVHPVSDLLSLLLCFATHSAVIYTIHPCDRLPACFLTFYSPFS